MKRNFKKLMALTCVFTMLTSTVAFAAPVESEGGSIVENDNSVAPSYLNCVLPLIESNTYDFTIDVDGLLDEYDTVGVYDAGSNVYFNAEAAAATLEITAGGDLYIIKKAEDASAEDAIEADLVGDTDASTYSLTKYYVWQPDTTDETTIAAGKGMWTQITAANIEKFFDITYDVTPAIETVTMKEDWASQPDVWDGKIYAETYVTIEAEDAAAYVAEYDADAKTITTLNAGLYTLNVDGVTYDTAVEGDLTYTPATRQFINVSDVATVVNKSTFPVAVSVNVAVTNENHGLVFGSADDFSGENDGEANMYMAIQTGSHAAALGADASASAYYVLDAATNSTIRYQDTATDSLTGSHNYYQYEAPEVTYDEQSFTLTATARPKANYDWDAYVDALLDGTYTKPEIKVVYDFIQVEEDAETANTYVDADDVVYTTDGADGWATVEAATDDYVIQIADDGTASYTFVDKPDTNASGVTAMTDNTGSNRIATFTNNNATWDPATGTITFTATAVTNWLRAATSVTATINGEDFTFTVAEDN